MISVRRLSPDLYSDYEKYVLTNHESTVYYSVKYLNFLQKILTGANDHYFLAYENDSIVGVLPAFISQMNNGCSVMASLPFYGSHGSILAPEKGLKFKETARSLISAYLSAARENSVGASTIITRPDEEIDCYLECYRPTYVDKRISQITPLPFSSNDVGDEIFKLIHGKTRNMIRKAQKCDFTIRSSCNEDVWQALQIIHEENMAEIGGLAKPKSVFTALRESFVDYEDLEIFVAEREGEVVSALLVIYYNKTVEYFTPVVRKDVRSDQPLSLLIFEAMKKAISKGMRFWNWGGTWLSQDGVFQFKSRWGSINREYMYFTKMYDLGDSLLNQSKVQLLQSYPYFFVIPFDKIKFIQSV